MNQPPQQVFVNNVLNVFDSFKLYKHQTNLLSQTFSNYFIKHNQIPKYPTINAEDNSIHIAKKLFSDRSIRITIPTLGHSLDTNFKH